MKPNSGRIADILRAVLFIAAACATIVPRISMAQALGTYSELIGPAGGTNSVTLANSVSNTWTATANASWLHTIAGFQTGTVSTNVLFTADQNFGATRSGTMTIAGLTLTVTQAGATYVPAGVLTTLIGSNLSGPEDLKIDGGGNVFVADTGNNAIKEWYVGNSTVTNVISSGLSEPDGLVFDWLGNLVVSDFEDFSVKVWATNNYSLITNLSFPFQYLEGVATYPGSDVIFINSEYVYEWISYTNLYMLEAPFGIPITGMALDVAGNVFVSDFEAGSVYNLFRFSLVISGLSRPIGVAVDGAGDIYVADSGNGAIREWTAVSNTVNPLVLGLASPVAVALDPLNNLYFCDDGNNTVKELPRAFVDPTGRLEPAGGGTDVLPAVLPTAENLLGPFAPYTDQPWLTINGITNGVVEFAVSANPTTSNRVANIMVLGQTIPITQTANTFSLSPLLEGPAAGADSVVLATSNNSVWAASTPTSWLHLTQSNQAGMGSTNVIFTFDANTGGTRTGTLVINGQLLSVTQAGATYVASQPLTTLVSSGLSYPTGLAVDSFGNVLIADTTANSIKRWMAVNNTMGPFISSNLYQPYAVAADGNGNIYTAGGDNSVKKWNSTGSSFNTLVGTALNAPSGLSLNSNGNVCIADTHDNSVKLWNAANSNVNTVISSGLNQPASVSVDRAGNIYVADTDNSAIKKWNITTTNVTTVVSSGLSIPSGMVVDNTGSVFIADTYHSSVKKWTAATGQLSTLVSTGLSFPADVALDGTGDLFISDTDNAAIRELPYAFVDSTPRIEFSIAGSDSLPPVLPVTENLLPPFAPSSDQSWLNITGTSNGVVSFSFTANVSTSNRVGHITLLGQTIAINQSISASYALGTNTLTEGAPAGVDSVAVTVNPPGAIWPAVTSSTWLHLGTSSGSGSTNLSFSFDTNTSTTRTGVITIAGLPLTVVQSGPVFALTPTNLSKGIAGGSNYISLTINPNFGTWTATANNSWLHIGQGFQSGIGGTNIPVTCDVNTGPPRTGTLTIAGMSVTIAQAGYVLSPAITSLCEGPGAGSDTFAFSATPSNDGWAATANNSWLHISSQYGSGSAVFFFSFETNSGGTRTGTITISGMAATQVVTIVQAGSTYIPAPAPLTTLAANMGFFHPSAIAVDGVGDVTFLDGYGAVWRWYATNNSARYIITGGLSSPNCLCNDSLGNVYVGDSGRVMEWVATNRNLFALFAPGFSPAGIALDALGNFYMTDSGNKEIKMWNATNGAVSIFGAVGADSPISVAVDAADNVYFSETDGTTWTVANLLPASNGVSTLFSAQPLQQYSSVAVDGRGNVYAANSSIGAVQVFSRANDSVSTIVSNNLFFPQGVTVDTLGNVYIADTYDEAVKELPRAFLDPTPVVENSSAGTDSLPPVLPNIENLQAPFNPSSDQSWLKITGVTNGIVSFSFTANNLTSNRVAHINLLGQAIPITQLAPPLLSNQPQGGTFGTGSINSLTVTATGNGNLSYQWFLNGTGIPGATNSIFNLANLQLTNAGLYNVVVSNTSGSVTSGIAVMNILPQLSAQLINGSISLSWPGPFILQSASLPNGPFVDLYSGASPYSESPGNTKRFYRLRSAPCNLAGTNLPGSGFGLGSAGIPGCNFVIEASTNLTTWVPLLTNPSPFNFVDTAATNYAARYYRAVLAH